MRTAPLHFSLYFNLNTDGGAMGADLYIHSSFDKAHRKYKPKFDEFVRRRDGTTNGRRDYYQRKAVEYLDKMYGDGYYRDSYNDSNLLWKLGLDYWEWFGSHLDGDRLLHPDKAEVVLNEVMHRRHLLEEIEDVEERKYFEEKFDEFTHFLEMAIGRGESIECSI
jgi:hypothetical protein